MRLGIALMLLTAAMPASPATTGDWRFRVLLDGREIGIHRYALESAGEGIVLRSEAAFDVRLLYVSVYRYRHEAVERWRGGCLASLESRTDTNGKRIAVTAAVEGGGLAVTRPAGRDLHRGCVMSFAYWDPRILEADRLLNSQTGEFVAVQVAPRGREAVPVRGENLAASGYRISGPGLQVDLWYVDGQWVALEALVKGGRRLRYELL